LIGKDQYRFVAGMTQETNSSSEKARDEALRGLSKRVGLTPQQISLIRLNQVHLATSSLVVEPDEFALTTDTAEKPKVLSLDPDTQRALIAWLVVRPDGPNAHLFPGTDPDGLDTSVIERVIGVVAADMPPAAAEAELPVALVAGTETSEPMPTAEALTSPPSSAVPLEEIETLREELAAADSDWSPAPEPEVPPYLETETESAPEHPAAEIPEPVSEAVPEGPAISARARAGPPPARPPGETTAVRPRPPRRPVSTRAVAPFTRTADAVSERQPPEPVSGQRQPFGVPYAVVAIVAGLLAVACCGALVGIGVRTVGTDKVTGLVAGFVATATEKATATPTTESPLPTPSETPLPPPSATDTPAPTDTPTAVVVPTDTPMPPIEEVPTSTPIIIVVTATPVSEPSPVVRQEPAETPSVAETEEAGAAVASEYKYPAPVLRDPADGGKVGGAMAILQWEPVSTMPLADDEWYAIRLVYLQQGQPVYQGDDIKTTDWRVPERFYYQADGPALEYRWFVYVEKKNADGTAAQLSPNSEEFVFRWE
jgi:hypothetical protein